ncbi:MULTISPECIES: hypothetical protein [unclassified Bradyrhizobium]|uniref:hypothetical protein n=1 Tax=unclassified Bradyrhizobium TaxID=2631580 RepID=UPI002479B3FB|nr:MULTISPECIES: hypothetical protein [unclassified Bradyrhizobium]WGR71028.1 hypothetical protein MTX24_37940 [Bradyrhizobium sp. ISRA426]WGR75865.1 hypothetical protein MTX21_23045 [Bradyrhizobium sp. ISRA430]WGR86269.1 hypothetical protein MTX25_37630 [Bradyrhizobium sp. ISRA432]
MSQRARGREGRALRCRRLGKQIGRIADALLAVIEHPGAHRDDVIGDDKAIAAFKAMMPAVAS